VKPRLKAPGSDRLKLYSDEPPSNFAFKLKFRRYSEEDNKMIDKIMQLMDLGIHVVERFRLTPG